MKQGFCYPAFLFGPFWLAAKRLWLALVVYLVVAALVGALVASGLLAPGAVLALELLAGLFIGFEGRHWLGAALTRRGLPLVDLIEARDGDEAARVYFTRALASLAAAPFVVRSASPRPDSGIIGLFPEARR